MGNWVFINGEFVPDESALIHFRDLAILRGYGIFDFFKVVNKEPVYLDDHLERFLFSAKTMRLPIQPKEELKEIIHQLIQKHSIPDYGIRMTLTGGYSLDGYQPDNPNFIIATHFFEPVKKEQFEQGIKLITYSHQRQLPRVKSIDYLMAVWLQPVIAEKGAYDVLYHQNGIITECPRSNIFMITKDEKIVTPSENILNGITRKKIIEKASIYFEVEERLISLKELYSASEVFISSTTKSVLPVNQIDDHIMPGRNKVIVKIKELLD